MGKKEAALQIASEFSISFNDNRGRKPPPKRKRKLSSEQKFERAEKKCFCVLSDYLCQLREWKEQQAALEKTMEKMEQASQPETGLPGTKSRTCCSVRIFSRDTR